MIFRIIKIAAGLILGLFISFLMLEKEPAERDLSGVGDVFYEEFNPDKMFRADAMRLRRAYGLNANDYEDYLYFAPESNMDVDELLIIRLKSEDQSFAVQRAIEERLQTQKNNFDGYGTDQLDLLEHFSKVIQIGKYRGLVVSGEADAWYEMVLLELMKPEEQTKTTDRLQPEETSMQSGQLPQSGQPLSEGSEPLPPEQQEPEGAAPQPEQPQPSGQPLPAEQQGPEGAAPQPEQPQPAEQQEPEGAAQQPLQPMLPPQAELQPSEQIKADTAGAGTYAAAGRLLNDPAGKPEAGHGI